jgi:flagellar hook-basal body complex protein FliE
MAVALAAGMLIGLVQALTSIQELTLDTATTIRDRVIEAYQEILRMPV